MASAGVGAEATLRLPQGTDGRYANCCKWREGGENCEAKVMWHDGAKLPGILLVAKKKISEGEQIVVSYGEDYWCAVCVASRFGTLLLRSTVARPLHVRRKVVSKHIMKSHMDFYVHVKARIAALEEAAESEGIDVDAARNEIDIKKQPWDAYRDAEYDW